LNCTFCGSETQEKVRSGKVIVIAHRMCVEDRKDELKTKDVIKCLLYEDRIKLG
jgi:hypothetical protein